MRAQLAELLADRSDSLDAFAQIRERDVRAERGACRLAVVGDSAADLRAKLSTAVERLDRGGNGFSFPQGLHCRTCDDLSAGRIAFMFPGQGSQRVGMVGELGRWYPGAWRLWEAADAALAGRLPRPLSRHVHPGADGGAAADAALTETHVAQPAMGVADAVVGHVLADLGLEPDMCVGHSYGEYAALHAARALGFEDLVVLSEARGRAVGEAGRRNPGAMLAMGAPGEVAERLIGECGNAVVANLNGPAQTVASGREEDIARLSDRCAKQGVRTTRLNVATAFHSPLVESARGPLREALARARFSVPEVSVYANATGEPHSSDPESIREALVDHLTMPVRFAKCVANMHRDGARIFLETGPGSVLSSLTANILQGTDAVAIPVDHRDGWFGLMNAAARLFVLGVPQPAERLRELFGNGESPVPARHLAAERRSAGNESPRGLADAAMVRHQRLMRLFVESQLAVMTRFLGTTRPDEVTLAGMEAWPAGSPTVADPALRAVRRSAPVSTPVERAAVTEGAVGTDTLQRLRSMVADLTGFPPDMLDPELDLEADLGIDSIKRVEILVEAQDRFPGLADALDEEGTRTFSRQTTLLRMAEYLESVQGSTPGSATDGRVESAGRAGSVADVPPRTAVGEHEADPAPDERAPTRRMPQLVPAPLGPRRDPGAGTVVVSGNGTGVAEALSRRLPEPLAPMVLEGGTDGSNRSTAPLGEIDLTAGYVHLGMLSAGPSTSGDLLEQWEAARRDLLRFAANLKALETPLRSSGGFVVAAAAFGLGSGGDAPGGIDPLAGGHLGLLKSVAKEWPEVRCRAVDVGPGAVVDATAGILADELCCDDDAVEVAYREGCRHVVVLPDMGPPARAAGEPLLEGDVVVVTGGARGITGEAVVAVAGRWRPRLVLVGRTVLADENPRYGGLSDMAELKREIADVQRESGEEPNAAGVEREYRSVVRRREIRRNLRRVRQAGAEVEYVAVDVGDRAAFGRVLADVRHRHGRIDGVVHGAGIREDRLLADKEPDSFERVLKAKVEAALTLFEHLDLDRLKLLCFFSSTAARYGSAGQSDYAAANETLNGLARWLEGRTPARVVSIGWGPWAPGVGMVDEALARRFRRRGVSTIPLRRGVAAFLDELASGAKGDAEVVYE